MRVLGIDPGSVVTGIGVIDVRRGRYHHVAHAVVRTSSSAPMGSRLVAIHDGLVAAMREHAPDAVAIEAIFRHKSSESALRLGQARGVALLAAAECGFEAAPYNAMTVKKTIGAHGHADKHAVARMVRMLLGVEVDGPADASDALAIAICHAAHARRPQAAGGVA